MSVEFITLKCPECGAMLSIEEGRQQAFCTYCGAKVLIHNGNEHIIRRIDEAEVKQAETERLVQMRKMELKEKNRSDTLKSRSQLIKLAVIGFSSGILFCIVGSISKPLFILEPIGFVIISMTFFLITILFCYTKPEDSDD